MEWFEKTTGHRENFNHCGRAHRIGDFWYCINDGKIEGYGMRCGNITPTKQGEQLSLFEVKP